MFLRFAAVAALCVTGVFAQSDAKSDTKSETAAPAQTAVATVSRLRADEGDPIVVRARERAAQTSKLVSAGALPFMRLKKAQEDVQDALDMSLLKQSLYTTDLLSEEADQMVLMAQRMLIRRQRTLMETQELVSAGVISRSEAETSNADLDRAKRELDWAEDRAKLVEQLAENARIQKGIASLEIQAESRPDW